MTTRDLLKAEIDRLPQEELEKLYALIKESSRGKTAKPSRSGALARLKRIRIEAPEDFSSNIDLYLTGEKSRATGPDFG